MSFKDTLLAQLTDDGWKSALRGEFSQPYFNKMCTELEKEYATEEIFPPLHYVFEAFNATPFDNVKVVIIGQDILNISHQKDPYHDNNQAHGLCFSVLPGIPPPPSLKNMYTELEKDIDGFKRPNHGYLITWAQQGVFMLNATLTVRAHSANSHKNIGWQKFTDRVIDIINEKKNDVVFALWGGFAQTKGKRIDEEKHHVLKCAHPSPLSAKAWHGCKVFSKINEELSALASSPIDWKLSPTAPSIVKFVSHVEGNSNVVSKVSKNNHKDENNNNNNNNKIVKGKRGRGDSEDENKDYHSMTAKELKDACREKGLPVSGSKGDLLLRISTLSIKVSKKSEDDEEVSVQEKEDDEDFIAKVVVEEDDDEDDEEEEETGNLDEESLTKMTVAQIKDLLKAKGLFTSGNKSQLIQRLLAAGKPEGKKAPAAKAPKKAAKKKEEEEDDGEEESEKLSEGSGSFVADPSPDDSDWSPDPLAPGEIKIVTWNVAGWGSVTKKGFSDYVKKEDPDIICLQETKISPNEVSENYIPGYTRYFAAGEKKGYSGVGVFTKKKPISITEGIGNSKFDVEGRTQNLEFENFYLINTYVPNASRNLVRLDFRMEWDTAFLAHIQSLNAKKPVIWCGDLNVAHQPIDLKNPKTNTKSAGFTPEERANFTKLLQSGFIDVWRHLNPGVQKFTYWSYFHSARAKNAGWRLDYFIISERFLPNIKTSFTRPSVLGSDHSPLAIVFEDKKIE